MVVTYVGSTFALTHEWNQIFPGQFISKSLLPKSFWLKTPLKWSQDLALESSLLITLTGPLEDSFPKLPRSLGAMVASYVSQNGRGSESINLAK